MEEKLFAELVKIVKTLRSPSGCPWDRAQTLDSMRSSIIEEAYEVAWAIDNKNWKSLKEELGDLLMLVVFLSNIAEEKKLFTLKEVLKEVNKKMIRRHPHVFGKAKARDQAEVLEQWEEIKKKEGRRKLLDGIPDTLPPLLKAYKVQERVARVGFDWKSPEGVIEKIKEEIQEVINEKDPEKKKTELGDLLFAVVNLSRHLRIDPQQALNLSVKKFVERFEKIEEHFQKEGRSLKNVSLEEMDEVWEKSKTSI